jgi:hypothetical protein
MALNFRGELLPGVPDVREPSDCRPAFPPRGGRAMATDDCPGVITVTVRLKATDPDGASDVKQVTCRASGSNRFTVQDTTGGIGHLVTLWVTDPAVLQGLLDKLNATATAIAQGNATAKAGAVKAFISQVQAQTGKSITPASAALLVQLVSAL